MSGSGNEMEELFGSDFDSDEDVNVTNDTAIVAEEEIVPVDELLLPEIHAIQKEAIWMKMPNILMMRPEEFTEESIQKEMEEMEDEVQYRNFVRWRYEKDELGNTIRKSNTKLVQWDNGKYTLFVGNEALAVSRQSMANSFIFANATSTTGVDGKEETILEGQKMVMEKMTVRPNSLKNKSHQSLTLAVHTKRTRTSRGLKEFITEKDPETEKQSRAKVMQDEMRLNAKKRAKRDYERDRYGNRMDADFLEQDSEEDEDFDEEDIEAIKDKYTQKSKRRKTMVSGGYDEYVDEHKSSHDIFEESSQEEEELNVPHSKRGHEVEDDEEDDDEDMDVPTRKTTTSRRSIFSDSDSSNE